MYQLEWSKSGPLTTTNLGEKVEQQELSLTVGGNAKLFSHDGRQFGIACKTKHTFTTSK